MSFPSRILETAIQELEKLPGVGRKTATRFALYLLKQKNGELNALMDALTSMKEKLCYCKTCYNISDKEICSICSNPRRSRNILCVVEDIRDVLAIERTRQYHGLYHILGGVISPVDGIGPADLNIEPLVKRIAENEFTEVIMALSPTMEGDTTNFYIYKRLSAIGKKNMLLTTIARGIAIGNELEYTDEITLGRSILNRVPFEHALPVK